VREADPDQLIGALSRLPTDAYLWRDQLPKDRRLVLYCQDDKSTSPHLTQWLIESGINARLLEGGIAAWRNRDLPTCRKLSITPTQWVTRERPKVDRIACPWLVRSFIDPEAAFFYMRPEDISRFAAWSGAIPFDVKGAEFGHIGDRCSFDAFLRQFQIADAALDRLALIVRGADTGVPELTPQSSGLLALSQGLSAVIRDDQAQLEHGMVIYDALYAWCRQQVGSPLAEPTRP
jgi:hypothetical protein